MGKIVIEAYGKEIYNKSLPDKVCFAIAKDREKRDSDYAEKTQSFKQDVLKKDDVEAFK